MRPKLLSPDIEVILPAYLRALPSMAGVFIGRDYKVATVPAITIQRSGGAPYGLIDYPTLSINVWASNDKAANDLALRLMAELEAINNNAPIIRIDPSGPSPITPSDVSGAVQRYLTATAEVRRAQVVN